MPTWVITGANRGLGLEFVRQLTTADTPSTEPNTILALVRSSTTTDLTALHALQRSPSNHTLSIHECDTSSATSISSFASTLSSLLPSRSQINYLVNNAGINSVPTQHALSLSGPELHAHMDTNVLGPALLTQNLLPMLSADAVILNMTSGLGSFGKGIFDDGKTVYGISKAALNMFSAHLATRPELVEKRVRVVLMDPGWVKTDMGGQEAVLELNESVEGMLAVLEEVQRDVGVVGRAVYRQFDGGVVPW